MRKLIIRRESIESRAALELISELNMDLAHRYPEEGANHFRLDAAEVQPGRGAFLIARAEQLPVGCAALRRVDPATAEIKRMYVLPKYRGKRIGWALLERLEHIAHELAVERLVLETGDRQPESLALYGKYGFTRIPVFGEYVNSPLSVCMEKRLKLKS